MNRKLNTILFLIGATLVNILVMVLLFLIFFVLFARFVAPSVAPEAGQYILLGLFVLSVIGTYFIYHRIIAALQKRVQLEKHFGPIFRKR